MKIKITNHKHTFPPRGNNTPNMLREIADKEPDYAFVLEWPKDGSMPRAHTTTEDLPVLAYRLQEILSLLHSGKNPLKIK